jgi:hypothetical protein
MKNKSVLEQVSDCLDPIKATIVLVLVIGLMAGENLGAQEKRTSFSQPGEAPKAGKARTTKRTPNGKKIATQKLMRNPWERGSASMELDVTKYGMSNEELPYFYW